MKLSIHRRGTKCLYEAVAAEYGCMIFPWPACFEFSWESFTA